MTKAEVVARLRQGLKKVPDKKIHIMVDLEINRINQMDATEFTLYLDKYVPPEPIVNDNIQVRRHR